MANAASRRVRVGLAGLGRMGQFHAENLAGRIPSVELVRLVEAVEDLARSIGDRLGVAWSTSYDDLLADRDVEAVVIATPTPLHAEMIERAAAAGKHVFCEKPISLELEPAKRAVEATERAGMKLQIGFHRRFDPDWAAATTRIKGGELGQVFLFRTTLRDMQPPPIDYLKVCGGFFLDTMIHDFDTARWMIGEIDELTAFGAALSDSVFAELGDPDNTVVVLRFANGALGAIDNSRVAGYGYDCSTEVLGSQATVRIDHHRRVHLDWLTPGSVSVDHVESFVERFPLAYRLELEDFAAAILADRPVAVSGRDGLAAFMLSQAARRSFQQGRTVRLRHHAGATGVTYELAEET